LRLRVFEQRHGSLGIRGDLLEKGLGGEQRRARIAVDEETAVEG
jgi:hypothetical protein